MTREARIALMLSAGLVIAGERAMACDYHLLRGLPEPTGIWPTTTGEAAAQVQALDATNDAAINDAIINPNLNSPTISNAAISNAVSTSSAALATPALIPTIDTYVSSWMLNTTGVTGRSGVGTINMVVSQIPANIQQVRYTSTSVYIKATGIPDYNIGSFNGNPNIPANSNATFDIPRSPQPATTHTATGLGAIGVLINGVEFFNMSDANSYQSKGVWHNNAGVVEAPSFDAAKAHPQQQGVYHNHEDPVSLEAEIGANSTTPKVIGYAIDGYPIMNDYASLTANGPVVKMMSGYQLKSYPGNVRANGAPNVNQTVNGQTYVNGYFEEDYQYVANQTLPSGQAELDQYNGATVFTPQFPGGTYAYFATTDTSGNAAYPYMVGPSYYGTPMSDDLAGATITVPVDSLVYSVPEPASAIVGMIGLGLLRSRRSA